MNVVSRCRLSLAVYGVLAIASVTPVYAGLVTVDAETSILYSIDRETAAATPVGRTEVEIMAGLAYDPINDILYGTATKTGILYSIDDSTGTATEIGDLGVTLMHGLAYDPSTKTLFGTFGESEGDGLYSIDVSTGVATLIGNIGFFNEDHRNAVHGLAVHPKTNQLYGVVAGPAGEWSALIEIDKTTGEGTLIAEDTPHFSGLAFDRQTSVLYGIDNWTGELYSIDIGTGKPTLIGDTGLENPLGLEDIAAIPEPATLCLLALGSLVLLRTARK